MTKIGEDWDYAQYQSKIFDPYSWEHYDDPNNWAHTARYWGNAGAMVTISIPKYGDYVFELKGNGEHGRWSYYDKIQGRYVVTRNEPGHLTVTISGGTDWTAPFDAADSPTNFLNVTLTVEPYTIAGNIPVTPGGTGGVAVGRLKGTRARSFNWRRFAPIGEVELDSREGACRRTRENGAIQYGLKFPLGELQGWGTFTWSPLNTKKGGK